MGNFTETFYHFVWATKRREPLITPEVEPVLHDFIRHKCAEMGITVYAVNGMPDHVHLACTVPMTLAHSDFLEKIKGGSSYFVNHRPEWRDNLQICLRWQSCCGVLTYTRRDLPRIVAYIDNQKRRHAQGTLWSGMERCDDGCNASLASSFGSLAPTGVFSAQPVASAAGIKEQ